MAEVFPVLAGIVVGLVAYSIASRRLQALFTAVMSLAFGVTASWVSGELAVSWLYAAIDVWQVLLAAVLTTGLVTIWRRRRLARG